MSRKVLTDWASEALDAFALGLRMASYAAIVFALDERFGALQAFAMTAAFWLVVQAIRRRDLTT